MNITALIEFELAYFDVTVQHISKSGTYTFIYSGNYSCNMSFLSQILPLTHKGFRQMNYEVHTISLQDFFVLPFKIVVDT